MCIDSKKPYLVVEECNEDNLKLFLKFLVMYKIKVLNVAGNRESKNPGVQARVCCFLMDALENPEG
jgi:hypothetical protein